MFKSLVVPVLKPACVLFRIDYLRTSVIKIFTIIFFKLSLIKKKTDLHFYRGKCEENNIMQNNFGERQLV